ncbi:MAG: hypothetical protein Q4E01_06790 [Actinomycetaceae bacterium]|nr:hypothetical protein [Actinomycetaceae bacterium]
MGTYSLTLSRSEVSSLEKRHTEAVTLFAGLIVAVAVVIAALTVVGLAINSTLLVVVAGLIGVAGAYAGMFGGLRLLARK